MRSQGPRERQGVCSFCCNVVPNKLLSWFGSRRICKMCKPESWRDEVQLARMYGIITKREETLKLGGAYRGR